MPCAREEMCIVKNLSQLHESYAGVRIAVETDLMKMELINVCWKFLEWMEFYIENGAVTGITMNWKAIEE